MYVSESEKQIKPNHQELLNTVDTYPFPFELTVKCKKSDLGRKGLTIQYSTQKGTTSFPVKVPKEGKHRFNVTCMNCGVLLNFHAVSLEKEKSEKRRARQTEFTPYIALSLFFFYLSGIGIILGAFFAIAAFGFYRSRDIQRIFYIRHPFKFIGSEHPFEIKDILTGQIARDRINSRFLATWVTRRPIDV
ncbi:MAG: hypothetical protein GPJ54_16975 [Candidatus Heimdallarchaeota archaeon]|nr:hypothetical protein [Candidatus Heimdallarchaeota archaeon]